jgi:hypothetical protein
MAAKPRHGALVTERLASLLPLLAVLACSGSPTAPSGPAVSIATVVAASYSGIQPGRDEVIRDGIDWNRAWEEIHAHQSPRPALPAVDFGQEMLLLASLGARNNGCYSVTVVAVEEDGSRLRAVVEEATPSAGCACTEAVTRPVHVVRLARRSEPVDFVHRQTPMRCG